MIQIFELLLDHNKPSRILVSHMQDIPWPAKYAKYLGIIARCEQQQKTGVARAMDSRVEQMQRFKVFVSRNVKWLPWSRVFACALLNVLGCSVWICVFGALIAAVQCRWLVGQGIAVQRAQNADNGFGEKDKETASRVHFS